MNSARLRKRVAEERTGVTGAASSGASAPGVRGVGAGVWRPRCMTRRMTRRKMPGAGVRGVGAPEAVGDLGLKRELAVGVGAPDASASAASASTSGVGAPGSAARAELLPALDLAWRSSCGANIGQYIRLGLGLELGMG